MWHVGAGARKLPLWALQPIGNQIGAHGTWHIGSGAGWRWQVAAGGRAGFAFAPSLCFVLCDCDAFVNF
jgi:hypothetical protein